MIKMCVYVNFNHPTHKMQPRKVKSTTRLSKVVHICFFHAKRIFDFQTLWAGNGGICLCCILGNKHLFLQQIETSGNSLTFCWLVHNFTVLGVSFSSGPGVLAVEQKFTQEHNWDEFKSSTWAHRKTSVEILYHTGWSKTEGNWYFLQSLNSKQTFVWCSFNYLKFWHINIDFISIDMLHWWNAATSASTWSSPREFLSNQRNVFPVHYCTWAGFPTSNFSNLTSLFDFWLID